MSSMHSTRLMTRLRFPSMLPLQFFRNTLGNFSPPVSSLSIQLSIKGHRDRLYPGNWVQFFCVPGMYMVGPGFYAPPRKSRYTMVSPTCAAFPSLTPAALAAHVRNDSSPYQIHLELQYRFGDTPVKLQVVCPQNGTAVLKGLTHKCPLAFTLNSGRQQPRATIDTS